MASAGENDRRKRRTRLIAGGVLTLVVLLTVVQVLLQKLRSPIPIASTVLISALVNINLILLFVLILLVFRNLFTVYLERRDNILGSKFRVKLVLAFMSLALLPALFLFVVASRFITTSVDSWFNVQVEESLQASVQIVDSYYYGAQESAMAFARQISRRLAEGGFLERPDPGAVRAVAEEKLQEYRLAAVQVFAVPRREVVSLGQPRLPARSDLVRRGFAGEVASVVEPPPHGDLIRAVSPITLSTGGKVLGVVAVGLPTPKGLVAQAENVRRGVEEYGQLKNVKDPIKGIYRMLFLMITLVILFGAIWAGMHLVRGVTGPIQRLAEGTRAVAAGDLDFRVDVKADDEIGVLVTSFNTMTADLKKSRAALDERRAYMEAVLETVAAGVLSLDGGGRVNTVNPVALRILGWEGTPVLHRHYRELFDREPLTPLYRLLQAVSEGGPALSGHQVTITRGGGAVTLVVNVSLLRDREGTPQGMVVVLEDITQLLRAQQEVAWREVARRMAHEIKNPLTPIQLSAQRIAKKLAEGIPDAEQVVKECTETIVYEVEALKNLVDEFSRYARLPASVLRPDDLHPVVEKVVALYAGYPEAAGGAGRGVKVRADLAPSLPRLHIDPEQIKRVVINLVENAVAALDGDGEVVIRTRHQRSEGAVLLEVADTGRGISPEARDRLFFPYFSTKRSGTGLGLAIVSRIVTEHGGRVWVEDNVPRGTRVLVELPVPPHTAVPTPASVEA